MKRALCILLTLLLLCGTVSVASATSDYDEHKHHWVNMGDDRDATCTGELRQGLRLRMAQGTARAWPRLERMVRDQRAQARRTRL